MISAMLAFTTSFNYINLSYLILYTTIIQQRDVSNKRLTLILRHNLLYNSNNCMTDLFIRQKMKLPNIQNTLLIWNTRKNPNFMEAINTVH